MSDYDYDSAIEELTVLFEGGVIEPYHDGERWSMRVKYPYDLGLLGSLRIPTPGLGGKDDT
jgi:hypothetical protein